MSSSPFDYPDEADKIAFLADPRPTRYVNPFDEPDADAAADNAAMSQHMDAVFEERQRARAAGPVEPTWTEAETCEVWGGCEQHPLPAVEVEQAEAAGLVVRPESPAAEETAAILADPDTMAAIAEATAELDACPKCGRLHYPWCAPHGGQAAGTYERPSRAEVIAAMEPPAPAPVQLDGKCEAECIAHRAHDWDGTPVTSAAELLREVRAEKRAPATIPPTTNRADAIRVIAACEAVAKALRDGLTGEARTEWEDNGTRAAYDVPAVGKLVASIDQAGVKVSDRDAWMKHAAKRWPGEMVMVPQWRNPEMEKKALAELAGLPDQLRDEVAATFLEQRAAGRVLDDEGLIVPGLAWVEGGTFRSASLTVDSKLKRHVADVAQAYVAGKGPLEIEGM